MSAAELSNEQQADPSNRRLVAGRYRLNSRIGRGRLGDIFEADDEVYCGIDENADRRVAIQLLPGKIALNNALMSKLKMGYAVIRAASHPNIVSYFDIEHDGRFGYLIMDRLDGSTLRSIMDDATTLPLHEAKPVIRAVGDALQFLHAKSIVHGQLTTDNVFVTKDLGVQLLDVVPLNSAETTLRDGAGNDLLDGFEVADDIYALGCLVYEMLAGQHPFNFLTPAEARDAGIKLTRIESLPAMQWNALVHALSFDPAQRTPSVAEFMRQFEIKGAERLQPPEEAHVAHVSTPAEPRVEAPADVHATDQIASDVRIDPPLEPVAQAVISKPSRSGSRWVPLLILAMILAGVAAWFSVGQPRDDLVVLTNYIDAYLGDTAPAGSESDLPIEIVVPASTAAPVEVADVVELTGENAEAFNAAGRDVPLSSAAASAVQASKVPADDTTPIAVEAQSLNPEATVSGPVSELALIESYVSVSERDGAAHITSRRPVGSTGPVFWWTADQTAVADSDYIAIETPVEGFTSGEAVETLLIPLVNDSMGEPRESFFVFLGQHSTRLGRLEPILRVRVDISDDDY